MKRTSKATDTGLQPLPTIDREIPASEIVLPGEVAKVTTVPTTSPKPKWLRLSAAGQKAKQVLISDLADASITFQCWRDRHSLGNSQLRRECGFILAEDEKTVVARVSYNGRVWNPSGGLLMEAVKPEPAKASDPAAVKERLAACAKALHEYWETQRLLEAEMGFTIHDIDRFVGDNFTVSDITGPEDVDDDALALWMDYATANREWEV